MGRKGCKHLDKLALEKLYARRLSSAVVSNLDVMSFINPGTLLHK
jgi:hypothetical protein